MRNYRYIKIAREKAVKLQNTLMGDVYPAEVSLEQAMEIEQDLISSGKYDDQQLDCQWLDITDI